jgi:hypothetical protein
MDVASLWIPVIIVSWVLQWTELRRISDTPSLWHGVVCVLQVSKARERTVKSQALVSAKDSSRARWVALSPSFFHTIDTSLCLILRRSRKKYLHLDVTATSSFW